MKLVVLFIMISIHYCLQSMNSLPVWKIFCHGDWGNIRISDKQKNAFGVLNQESNEKREVLDGEDFYALTIPIAPQPFCHLLTLHRYINNPKKQRQFLQLLPMNELGEILIASQRVKALWAQKVTAKAFYKKICQAACSPKHASQALTLISKLPKPMYKLVQRSSKVSRKLLTQEWKTSKISYLKHDNAINDLAISNDGKWVALLENDYLVVRNVSDTSLKLALQRNKGKKENYKPNIGCRAKTDIQKAGIFNSDATFFAYIFTKFTERDRKREKRTYDASRDVHFIHPYNSRDTIRIISLPLGIFMRGLDHNGSLQSIAFKPNDPEVKFVAATTASGNNLIVWDCSEPATRIKRSFKAVSDLPPHDNWGTVLAWGQNDTLFLNNGTTIEQWSSIFPSPHCIKRISLPVDKIKSIIPLVSNESMVCVVKGRKTYLRYVPSGQYLGCITSKANEKRKHQGPSVRLSMEGNYIAVFNSVVNGGPEHGGHIQILDISPIPRLALEHASLEQKIAIDALLTHPDKELTPVFEEYFELIDSKDILNPMLASIRIEKNRNKK